MEISSLPIKVIVSIVSFPRLIYTPSATVCSRKKKKKKKQRRTLYFFLFVGKPTCFLSEKKSKKNEAISSSLATQPKPTNHGSLSPPYFFGLISSFCFCAQHSIDPKFFSKAKEKNSVTRTIWQHWTRIRNSCFNPMKHRKIHQNSVKTR